MFRCWSHIKIGLHSTLFSVWLVLSCTEREGARAEQAEALAPTATQPAAAAGEAGSTATTTTTGSAPISSTPFPRYLGTPPPHAELLHELSPDRFKSHPPTQDVVLEVVYDLGYHGGEARAIHVSGAYVYWEILGRLMQAPKDGGGPITQVGTWDLAGQSPIRSDATHVYWIDREELKRYPHVGGEVEVIPLPWDHTSGDLRIDQRYVYVAMPGCPALTRIDKTSLVQESVYASVERPAPTTVLLRGAELFCASGPWVFRVDSWSEEEMQPHVEVVGRIFAAETHEDHIYWFEEAPGAFASTPYMWRAPIASDGKTRVEAEQLREAVGWIYEFVPGPPGVWALEKGAAPLTSLIAYLPGQDEARMLAAKVGTGGGVSTDEHHYYFTQLGKCCTTEELDAKACRGVCCRTCSAIARIPLSTPAMPIPQP